MWGGLSVGDGAICSSTHLAGGYEPLGVLNDVLWRRLGLYLNYLASWQTRAFAIGKRWRIWEYSREIVVARYRMFSRDATVAMLGSLKKETAAMLVSTIDPPGIGFYSYATVFFVLFCFG